MTKLTFLRLLSLCLLFAGPVTANAQSLVYEYQIQHPVYGDIGTYINTVDHIGDQDVQVSTTIRVDVKLAGLSVYRQQADRIERWRGDRMMSFHGTTRINERLTEISGAANDQGFVITSPGGTRIAPAEVRSATPWSARKPGINVVMSPSTGRVFQARVTATNEILAANGRERHLQRYDIVSDKRETVWLDDSGVPVAFRTQEDGTSLDFLLVRYPEIAAQPAPSLP